MKEKEELTEEQVAKWLQDHKKIFFQLIEDPMYYGVCYMIQDPSEYIEYKGDIPFEQKFKIGPGKYWDAYYNCGVWYTRIEPTPYPYTMKNPYDKYYTVYFSRRNPQLIELEKENEKFKEEMKQNLHTHWWK